MTMLYIGSFPRPYGGVTNKNEYLFQALRERMKERIDRIDTQALKRNPALIISAGLKWLSHQNKTLIVGTAAAQRRRITLLLNRFQPALLSRAILMVMGGNFAGTIAHDANYIEALKKYRVIYVETLGMMANLKTLGITNTAIFPNCRKRPEKALEVKPNMDKTLKCVFFSQISQEKGIDIVLEAAARLKNVHFDIWGGGGYCITEDGMRCRFSTD